MKRALVLAAVAVSALGASGVAQAATWKGVVVAKDAKRHTLVTASANGAVRTIRSPQGLKKEALGDVLVVRGARLPDGTFSAASTRRVDRRSRVRLRGTVVRRMGARLLLSAGHSVLAVSVRKEALSLRSGDRVSLGATVGRRGLHCSGGIDPIGHDGQLELEGIYLSTDGDVLSLAVVHRGLVKVTVPDGIDLPELTAGDELALLVRVEPDGSFTLVQIEDETAGGDDGDGDGDGVDIGKNQFTVTGILASISADAVSVTVERHPEPVRCAIPSGTKLEGFAVGQLVQMQCYFTGGRFVLYELHSQTGGVSGGGEGELELTGFIASLDAAKVVVEVAGGDPVTCLLKPGQDLRGFAAGDFVELGCRFSKTRGDYVLTELSSETSWLGSEPNEDGLYASFDLQGVVSALTSTYVAVRVAHHTEPVSCSVAPGMDLRGFAVGDSVELDCDNAGSGFVVSSISSPHASWSEDEMPEFTLDGILRSIGTDSVGVEVERHPQLVRCTMPLGTNLSGFAIGDTVELHCHFHDGKWNLATLDSDSANLTLED